jgi:uncharacterized protein
MQINGFKSIVLNINTDKGTYFMKRVYIVHCWEGYPDYCWYPWVKQELEALQYQVTIPAMPETDLPKQSLWVSKLKEVIGEPDDQTFLIGHSIGCATILRYLETLKPGQQIGGVVLVAGFAKDIGFDEIHNFFTTSFNFPQIKSASQGFVAIHSDDDPFVDLSHSEDFRQHLGADIVLKQGKKHFSGSVDDEVSCKELPEVVESIVGFLSR